MFPKYLILQAVFVCTFRHLFSGVSKWQQQWGNMQHIFCEVWYNSGEISNIRGSIGTARGRKSWEISQAEDQRLGQVCHVSSSELAARPCCWIRSCGRQYSQRMVINGHRVERKGHKSRPFGSATKNKENILGRIMGISTADRGARWRPKMQLYEVKAPKIIPVAASARWTGRPVNSWK